jgi:hypothetical protein
MGENPWQTTAVVEGWRRLRKVWRAVALWVVALIAIAGGAVFGMGTIADRLGDPLGVIVWGGVSLISLIAVVAYVLLKFEAAGAPPTLRTMRLWHRRLATTIGRFGGD